MLPAICLGKQITMRRINTKKAALLFLKIAAAIMLLLVIGFFAFRNTVLNKAIARAKAKMETEYNSTFTIGNASFKGLSGIEINNITLKPHKGDTLLNIETVKTSINLSRLFTGDIQLGTLQMKNGYIQLVKNEQGKNFDTFLHRKKNSAVQEKTEGPDYARRTYKLLQRALNLVPTDMQLENLTLKMDDNGRKVNMNLKKLKLADEQLESYIAVKSDNLTQNWEVKGFADPRDRQADLKFYNSGKGRIIVPYLDERFGLKSGFDSIRVNVENIDLSGDEFRMDGFASIGNFMVNHPKIATKDVVINSARFDYHFLFGPDFIELDSTSTVELNKIKVKPFARYSIEKDTIYQFKAGIPKMLAQDFINSLPNGLFTHFEGMEAEGSFSYNLDFMYNKNKPDDIVFDSSIKKEGFRIKKYGEANLAKLNTSFVYRAVDNGIQQRPILVGPDNPNYTPYELIPAYLKNAVLTSEDPSFFHHRGFINEAFKQSIVKNIKTKKFARGASTISMQLVKNVFLTREKTLSRKLEEILLVYILENNRIASKERMFEVYLNIIEWGPNVYGIGEAAQYYFQKQPIGLTLDESVYLASIVPRPKKFMWRFNNEGYLKEFAVTHDNYIKKLMVNRGIITPADTTGQSGQINVTGPARERLNLKEGTAMDIDTIETESFLNKLFKGFK